MIPFDDFNFEQLLPILEENRLRGIYLYHPDLEWMWSEFQSTFKVIEAAGGLVKNKNDEILMIYRFDKWDLPKGKIEKGETIEIAAIREVTEETGVKGLRIENFLQTTYHVFMNNGKYTLKEVHWYAMKTEYTGKLKPEKKEGIIKVKWKGPKKIQKALQNSYANIKILFGA